MSSDVNGFAPIIGTFYCTFDATQGPKVLFQVPEDVVLSKAGSKTSTLIDFDMVKSYLIPKPTFCNRLVSLKYKNYQIVGHPVHIISDCYERNSFTFNFVFVFPYKSNSMPYESAITRLAKMCKDLEEQSRFLSRGENATELDSVLEQIFQDLNHLSECQIPLGKFSKINIKLFPILESPPKVKGYQVPVSVVKLRNIIGEQCDPTLARIIPYINGINSVKRVADLAEANYDYTCQCIQHLIHYDCIVITGIFQMANMYAPTPTVSQIGSDPEMFEEYLGFVSQYHNSSESQRRNSSHDPGSGSASGSLFYSPGQSSKSLHSHVTEGSYDRPCNSVELTMVQALQLYSGFQSGMTVQQWYYENKALLQNVDIRRMVIFGVIKQLIRRVHSYPIYDSRSNGGSQSAHTANELEISRAFRTSSIAPTPEGIELVKRCFSGTVHFDELCTELRAPRMRVSKLLKCLGEWIIINR